MTASFVLRFIYVKMLSRMVSALSKTQLVDILSALKPLDQITDVCTPFITAFMFSM